MVIDDSMGDEVRVTVIAAGFDRWDEGRDREAHLFAGVGVVAGSDPAAELAETEVKLQALLPLLAE